jgi:hypothetical protein
MPNLFRSELFSKGKKFESWFSSSKIKKFVLFRSEITLTENTELIKKNILDVPNFQNIT